MSFEQIVRGKITATTSKVAKGILKVVLGEYQQKDASGKATVNDGYSIVEKIVNGNKEMLGYLKPEDPRIAVLVEENEVVTTLLPPYLTVDDVIGKINGDTELRQSVALFMDKCYPAKMPSDIANAAFVGRAIGVVTKWCKANQLDVKGEVVKEALVKLTFGS